MGIGPIATQLVKLMNESLCELGKKTTEEKAIGYDPIEGEMDLWDFLTELLNYFPLVIRMEEVHRRNTTVVDFNGLTAKLITDGCDKVFSQKTADMDKLSRMQLSYLELMRLVISRGKLIKVETIEESNRLFQLLKGLISRDNGSVALSAYQILLDSAELSVPSEETRGTKFLELLELRPNFTPVCESDTNSLVFFSLCRYWTHQSPRKLFDDSDLFIAYLEKIFKLVVERMLSRLQNVTLLEESPLEDVRDEVFFCLVHSHLFSAVSFTRLLKDSGLTDNMLLQLSKFVANHWDALTDALEKMGNEQMLKKVNVPLGGLFTSIFTFAFG